MQAVLLEAADLRWQQALARFPCHDFHHLPDYVGLEAARRGGRPMAYWGEEDGDEFFVPFLRLPTPFILSPARATQADAVSPYGYAGPLIRCAGDEQRRYHFARAAVAHLVETLREEDLTSAMMRFHPLLPAPLDAFRNDGQIVLHGETVWVDLRKPAEQLWSETRSRFRSYIAALTREGYAVEMDGAGRDLPRFVELYHETMRRVDAEPHYFFSLEYFRQLQRVLGDGFLLAHVRHPDGDIVSSGLFTICRGIVQYHLSGNRVDAAGANALKLLLHAIRTWAREQGHAQFHLGGGIGGRSDSLFQFKAGFSPDRARFYTWRRVLDEPGYAGLRDEWERLNGRAADGIGGFFPAYRKLALFAGGPPPHLAGATESATRTPEPPAPAHGRDDLPPSLVLAS